MGTTLKDIATGQVTKEDLVNLVSEVTPMDGTIPYSAASMLYTPHILFTAKDEVQEGMKGFAQVKDFFASKPQINSISDIPRGILDIIIALIKIPQSLISFSQAETSAEVAATTTAALPTLIKADKILSNSGNSH
jgi:hypothetical protein